MHGGWDCHKENNRFDDWVLAHLNDYKVYVKLTRMAQRKHYKNNKNKIKKTENALSTLMRFRLKTQYFFNAFQPKQAFFGL